MARVSNAFLCTITDSGPPLWTVAAGPGLRTPATLRRRREPPPRVRVSFLRAEPRGVARPRGARVARSTRGAGDASARGGRYDEVGAIFGRNRPAVGFGLDVKDLALLSAAPPAPALAHSLQPSASRSPNEHFPPR